MTKNILLTWLLKLLLRILCRTIQYRINIFQVEFAGDNFIRISGDTVNHAKSQMFSWEAGAKGLDVHALAEPTKLEALKKEYEAKKTDFKSDAQQGRNLPVTRSVDQILP